MLLELTDAMRAIGKGSSSETMEQISSVSVDHHRQLLQILEHLPAATLRPVVECILQICDQRAGLPSQESAHLCRIARHLGVDPRSYREAARTFRVLADQIPTDSELDRVIGGALGVLDERGVLGRRRILELARFFVGANRRPGSVFLDNHLLGVADEDLLLADLVDYNAALQKHSPLWGPQAAALTLYPETQSYGAVLPKVETPLARTLLVDRPARALLPGRTVQRRWLRVDPIPAALKTVDPEKDMAPYVTLEDPSAWQAPERRPTLDVVYAGVRVAMSIVQPLWLNRLRLRVRLVPERGNRACYIADAGEIRVWDGPLSAWSIVHEMAHAIDDVLVVGPGMASEERSNPIHSFTTLVRPHYRDVAERFAKTIWQGMLKNGLDDEVRRRLSKGLVPLEEVVEGLPWLEPDKRDAVVSLVRDSVEVHESDVRRVLGEDRPLNGGEVPLITALHDSVVEDDQERAWIDINLGWPAFRYAELQYLLSDREIFARFFDQYARLYLAQLGAPYGPSKRPADLDPPELAALVPAFHKAMVEAQVLDLGHIASFTGRRVQEDTVLSIGIAAAMTAVGAGLVRL
jgi:hypothetical protein